MAQEARTRETEDNDILVTLSQINKGRVVTEANAKFGDLVDGVVRYGKPGTITIRLTLAPAKDESGIDLEAAVDVKVPQPKHPAYFFVNGRKLQREDPSMEPLFGRDDVRDRGDR